MSELQRETLGSIARLAEQMAYTAMQGHGETLRAQYDTMTRLMARLDVIRGHIEREA